MKQIVLIVCASVVGRSLAANAPDFSREVRPILSQHCFKCHGPDDKARKGGFRLDLRESAIKEAKSGAVPIVPGKAAKSEVVARIFSTDDDELMPPPAAKRPLNAAQKDVLKRWIEAGAEYQQHWAFIPPKQAELPGVKGGGKSANPIDRFIVARLEQAGLGLSPEKDPVTFCRRVHLDLIGLPPSPGETAAFVKSARADSQAAIDALVDRLLASPHYGERWGRKWLDLARYADTNGYEKDRPRSIWPYRDWVIRALNADMPFDRFTIEQIAGDMLPGATVEQRIAAGFHRNTMLNEEGGIDPNEFRFHAMTDRVATTGVTWLGLTVGCAQCHTHKFDPISQREYYQLMAFMNNADEPDVDIPLPDAEEQQAKNAVQAAKLLAELPAKFLAGNAPGKPGDSPEAHEKALEQQFGEWLHKERKRAVKWEALKPVEAKSNMPLLTIQPDFSILASGDTTKSDTYEVKFSGIPAGVTAVLLEALPDSSLPKYGPGMAFYEGPKGDFFLGEFQLSADGTPVKFAGATESYAKNNFGSSRVAAALALDGDPQTGWTAAGRMGERHTAVFNLPAPQPAAREWVLKMMMGRHYACSLGRFRISVTTDPRPAVASGMDTEVETLLSLADERLTSSQRARLREEFLLTHPQLQGEAAKIRALRKRPEPPITLGFRERPPENPRPTFIHNRGEFLQPTDRVEPGVPAFLTPLPAGAKRDRLALARWLVSSENPLTARVQVNRQWAAFFGRGLVRTTEDFGYQGDAPTHPELLDWLAVEFVKQGWSMKKLHRLIVTSATYRQSSRVSPPLLVADPDDRMLSRFPRLRLDAEIIRDAALAASGLLSDTMGGPGVYPPQPAGVTEVAYGGAGWTASAGPDRYRRSVYTFSKRTAPFALYNTFDGPTGEACIARRDVSNTALQSLTLLNDVVFIEAAQALGGKLAALKGTDEERLREAFRRVVCREPSAEESAVLLRFIEAQRVRFSAGELDRAKVTGSATASAEQAVWTALVRALFNLDEVVTKG